MAGSMQFGSSSTGLVSSIKKEVKKKQVRIGRSFSCFAAHLIELEEWPWTVVLRRGREQRRDSGPAYRGETNWLSWTFWGAS